MVSVSVCPGAKEMLMLQYDFSPNNKKIPCISNLGLLKYTILHCLDYICLGYVTKMFSVSKSHLLYI